MAYQAVNGVSFRGLPTSLFIGTETGEHYASWFLVNCFTPNPLFPQLSNTGHPKRDPNCCSHSVPGTQPGPN